MTTPDPDRKSVPFEWQALTINKVEQIQLERLHREQDRIEHELREQEAREREARAAAAEQRQHDELESAWFDAGNVPQRDTLEDQEMQARTTATTPFNRLARSLAGLRRLVVSGLETKRRTSVPPPPLNESPVSLSLVLAACAFGGSVYLSLRWVAEVRQANVTHQLSSTMNATTPASAAVRSDSVAEPPRVNTAAIQTPPATPAATAPIAEAAAVTAAAVTATAVTATAVTAATEPAPNTTSATPSRATTPLPAAATGSFPRNSIPATSAARPSATAAKASDPAVPAVPVPASPAEGTSEAQSPVRSRVLVPTAGSPHVSGTRVYRGGE